MNKSAILTVKYDIPMKEFLKKLGLEENTTIDEITRTYQSVHITVVKRIEV